jgi:hypothetical protein
LFKQNRVPCTLLGRDLPLGGHKAPIVFWPSPVQLVEGTPQNSALNEFAQVRLEVARGVR